MQDLGFVFPNDLHIHWNLMVVIYPYILGMVAGAFFISSLSRVFGAISLVSISKFSLIFALSWLPFVTIPLINHLGHPERALNMILTPNLQSPSLMAGFGILFTLYTIFLILEVLFVYRYEFIALRNSSTGLKKKFYNALLLGTDDRSAKNRKRDIRISMLLSSIGIPLAAVLNGYEGFVLGTIDAFLLWDTPLMPIIFFFSALVSGVAGVIFFYILAKAVTGKLADIETETLRTLTKILWALFAFTFTVQMLDIASLAYASTHKWDMIKSLLDGPLYFSYWTMQVLVLSIVPSIILAILSLRFVGRGFILFFLPIASLMLLAEVFFMRWNTVIGGQMLAKSERGFSTYHPLMFEKEGILVSIILLVGPIILFWILSRFFPLWDTERIKRHITHYKK